MRVFLTWSGIRSKHVANALHVWLPSVVQALDPWMSDEDIQTGTRWEAEITGTLADVAVGIVCLTPENQAREWVNFEAGAISKVVSDQTRVIPYLIDLTPEQVTGPLAHFQMASATEAGTLSMLRSLNDALGDGKLPPARLEQAFDRWWPEMRDVLSSIPAPDAEVPVARPPEALLAEVLENTREILRRAEFSPFSTTGDTRGGVPRYLIFTRTPGTYTWRIADELGNTLAVSEEDYPNREEASAAAREVRDQLGGLDIVDPDGTQV